jgi:hypothetical protein
LRNLKSSRENLQWIFVEYEGKGETLEKLNLKGERCQHTYYSRLLLNKYWSLNSLRNNFVKAFRFNLRKVGWGKALSLSLSLSLVNRHVTHRRVKWVSHGGLVTGGGLLRSLHNRENINCSKFDCSKPVFKAVFSLILK